MVRERSADAMISSTSSNNSDFTRVMGERLLAGWTMLADTCPRPGCNAPLMRDRSMEVHCCRCQAVIQSQTPRQSTQEQVPPSPSVHPNASNQASPVRPAVQDTGVNDVDDVHDVHEDDQSLSLNFPSYSTGGNRVLERAFAAYMESAAEQAGVDVSSYALSAPVDSVVDRHPTPADHGRVTGTTTAVETVHPSSSNHDTTEADFDAEVEAEAAAEVSRRRAAGATQGPTDEIANLLGQKMLSGWTLLEDQCPSCDGVPLVRDREGTMLCVGCNNQVVTRAEFDPQVHTNARQAASAAQTNSVPQESNATPIAAPTAPVSASTSHSVPRSIAGAAASAAHAHDTPAPRFASSGPEAGALSGAAAVLAMKLDELSMSVKNMPVSTPVQVDELVHRSVAMKALAEAMKSMR